MSEFKPLSPVVLPARDVATKSEPSIIVPRPAVLSATPDAGSLLKALQRRWAMALGLGLLAAAAIGSAAWFVVPRAKYTAIASLQIATKPKRIMFDPKESQADYRTYQRTQVALIKNRTVLSHALALPDVVKLETVREQVDADEWLEDQLKVEFPGASEVLQISLSGDRPEDVAKIVNGVVKSYITLIVDAEQRERRTRLDELKKLWGKYGDDLDLKRKVLREMATSAGTTDQQALALAQQFKTEHLAMARREQMRARSEFMKTQAELGAVEGTTPESPEVQVPESMIQAEIEKHPEIIRKKSFLSDVMRKHQESMRISKKSNDPSVLKTRGLITTTTKELADLTMKLRQSATERFRTEAGSGGSDAALEVHRLRNQLSMWKNYGEEMQQDIDRLQKETKDITEQSLDLENERDEISVVNDIARRVAAEVEALQVELGAPQRVQVLSEAKVPRKKDELRKLKAGGIAAFGAFLSALFFISYWEFRARRVDTVDEFSGLGIKLVGALPALPSRHRNRVGKADSAPDRHWQSLLVESIDAARTMLLHAFRVDSIRTVMVSSAIKGEGKTSLACHLATSLSRAGRRTLLVDCDFRAPATHRLFEMPPVPGLCELLRGEAGFADVTYETSVSGLDLIPAGRCDPLALQALAQDALRSVFIELKSRYDFIIVDSAPLLPVADSLLIGQCVDAVIFSVMRDVSRLPAVYAAYERLAELGVKILGAVITGIQCDRYSSYYSYESDSLPGE
jgi:polysaccharide biosynthesis transport protein